ncbi:outer membrane beta-barrel protein [Riemerella columbina]|uniref:outer membrane beta-barrel protein n=1 Tax=Riemerella columbina TaxID=103810 RepID=UPI00266F359F|nr:outer membrane beta-barrel protein [Riemerella columbina]WKS95295.1 outer membrane beta-barrel protein [Riemerella columbina]
MKIKIAILSVFAFGVVTAQEQKQDTIDTKNLQEVIIKSQRKKQYADHASYTFDKKALELARHSKDLLETLPELLLDPVTQTIKNIKGGKTLFLVNGIEASDNQIKSIAPTNVVRVEYFDIPPARYAQRADTVVNIITRNPELGYSYGANITTSPLTGFTDGSGYVSYTKGNNDFGLEYQLNYRNYDNRQAEETYAYQLNGQQYRTTNHSKEHFGYTSQNIELRYTRAISGDYTFQAKLKLWPFSYFSDGEGQSLYNIDTYRAEHQNTRNEHEKFNTPTLDLYFSKPLGKKDELSLNLVGSHYRTQSTRQSHEWDIATNADIFNDHMLLNAKQTGIIGEVAHTHQFEKGKLSSGYRVENTAVNNDLKNLLGATHYDVNYFNQYFYTEYSGKWAKLSYRIGIGLSHIRNKSKETVDNQWTPSPKFVLSYPIKNNQSLRLTSYYTSNSPQATALSSNVAQIVPNIVKTGNPYLKSQQLFRNNLIYSFNSKYIDVNFNAFYNRVYHYFSQRYVASPVTGGYALTYENADFSEYGASISGSYKPFGNNLLNLSLWLNPVSMKLKTQDGQSFQNQFIQNRFSLLSQYKNFKLQYTFLIPVFSINGAFLSKDENANHLAISYQLNNWQFSTGMYWIGMPSQYETQTLDTSLVNYTQNTKIFNNKNMLIFGLSYDFSTGKKLQTEKKLQNNTAEAVNF